MNKKGNQKSASENSGTEEITRQSKPQKKKSKAKKIVLFSLLGVVLAVITAAAIYIYPALTQPEKLFTDFSTGQDEQQNLPLPSPTEEADKPKIMNILLLGIDQDYKSYAKDGGDFHTDSIIVVAVNFETNEVNMISLPRDTFTHVPGIRGIYKLNAAINCGGGKTEAGFKKVCEAASWMLGGINIDYYYAFELDAVVKIGNLIGGVDFDVDMAYTGSSGTYYEKGMQHLDGTGIYDYMRARKNSTGEPGDKGRMNRGRAILKAVFLKLKEQGQLTYVPQLISMLGEGTYTNLTLQQAIALADYASKNIDLDSIGSETMSGKTRHALGWDFCFIDQEHRVELIKKVYGVDVMPQQFVSYEYAKWLEDYGFKAIRYMATADEVLQYALDQGVESLDDEQRESYDAVKTARQQTQAAYDQAVLSLKNKDNNKLKKQRNALRESTKQLAELIGYPEKLSWSVKSSWNEDPIINEVNVNFR